MADIKYIDIKEFRERGYLQEANRRFFHPLGLSLEITSEEDGSEHLSGVWDLREDPEGIIFDKGYGLDVDKAEAIDDEFDEHAEARIQLLGQVIQPTERKIPHE
jgi:hypothetical protein